MDQSFNSAIFQIQQNQNGTRKILSYFTSRNQQNNRFHSKTHLLFHHKNTLCCTKIPLVCYLGCFFIWERFRVAGYQSFSSATFWFPIVEIHKTINSTRKLIYYCVSTLCQIPLVAIQITSIGNLREIPVGRIQRFQLFQNDSMESNWIRFEKYLVISRVEINKTIDFTQKHTYYVITKAHCVALRFPCCYSGCFFDLEEISAWRDTKVSAVQLSGSKWIRSEKE